MSDCNLKVDKPGFAYCLYSNLTIAYRSWGKRHLRKHAQNNEAHKNVRDLRRASTALPGSYFKPHGEKSHQVTCELPYVAAHNVHQKKLCE